MRAVAPPLSVLAVTGIHAEARIAAGRGVTTLVGGCDEARLAVLLQECLARGVGAVISFGIAGGLEPSLRAGTVVVADVIDDGETLWATDGAWRARLLAAVPGSIEGTLAGTNRAVADLAGKAALRRRTRAAAVDMESHIAARLAAQHDVPFVALRVVADPADRALPHAALVGLRPDGSTDVGAVVRALIQRPTDLPALVRTAFDARSAFAALTRSRRHLDDRLGFGEWQRFSSDRATGFGAALADPPLAMAEATADGA